MFYLRFFEKKIRKNERTAHFHSFPLFRWAMWVNRSFRSNQTSDVSKSLRSLTKNERPWAIRSGRSEEMSYICIVSESLIFGQKTSDMLGNQKRIPSPDAIPSLFLLAPCSTFHLSSGILLFFFFFLLQLKNCVNNWVFLYCADTPRNVSFTVQFYQMIFSKLNKNIFYVFPQLLFSLNRVQ